MQLNGAEGGFVPVAVRWAVGVGAVVVAGMVFTFRFLTVNGLPNDHFVHLAGAQQLLLGEWPSRDFVDPGMPMMYGASALAQLAGGSTLLSEVVLVAGAFAVAAALTFILAWVASSRQWVALLAVLLEVAIYPRSYSYPKMLLYAGGVAAMWWYAARPQPVRRLVLAAAVVLAFLFRHDHGLFLGAAALLTVVLAARTTAAPAPWREAAAFVGVLALLAAPYAIYIGLTVGLGRYVSTAVGFSAAEARQTALELPAFMAAGDLVGVNADAWLFYAFHAMPMVALVVLVAGHRPVDAAKRTMLVRMAPLCLLAVAVNVGFMRDPLRARVADAVVPAGLLAAWLAGRAFDARGAGATAARAGLGVVMAATAAAVTVVGSPYEQLDRMGAFAGVSRLPEFYRERAAEMRGRFDERQVPSRSIMALRPVFAFLDRCTTPRDHLLVTTFAPEIYWYARRPFAGGYPIYFPGYLRPDEEAEAVRRLEAQSVPFAILPANGDERFDQLLPRVSRLVREAYQELVVIDVADDEPLRVVVKRALTGVGRDAQTGWPCPVLRRDEAMNAGNKGRVRGLHKL